MRSYICDSSVKVVESLVYESALGLYSVIVWIYSIKIEFILYLYENELIPPIGYFSASLRVYDLCVGVVIVPL